MTMEEVEYRTPNGLHDAYLLGLSTDYKAGTLTLDLEWFVGLSTDLPEARPEYKPGQLVISGLRYCVIESPEKGDGTAPDQINGFATGGDEIQRCHLPDVDDGIFRHTIYLGYWTSFIHFAGANAEVFPPSLIVREMGA
jgi:hypothetical protein